VLSERGLGSPVIDDISHAWPTCSSGATRSTAISDLSVGLRPGVRATQAHGVACLTPPKVQTQSRFMNVHRLVRWADRVPSLLPAAVPRRARCWRVAHVPGRLARLSHPDPQFRDDAVCAFGMPKDAQDPWLTHDTLTQCEPLLDTWHRRVRQEFARYLTISSRWPRRLPR